MRILLAIDGSSSSDRAVGIVGTTPWPEGSAIRVVHVAEPVTEPFLSMPGVLVDSETIDRIAGRARTERRAALEDGGGTVRPRTIRRYRAAGGTTRQHDRRRGGGVQR